MRLYHYTTGAHIHNILESGFLKLTPSPERLYPGERPLVWLTTDHDMPPTALKPMRLGEHIHYPTADELCMYAGIYRFTMAKGLKVAKWSKILDRYGADPGLADIAERMGEDPATWRAVARVSTVTPTAFPTSANRSSSAGAVAGAMVRSSTVWTLVPGTARQPRFDWVA